MTGRCYRWIRMGSLWHLRYRTSEYLKLTHIAFRDQLWHICALNIYYNIVINNIHTVSFKIPYKPYLKNREPASLYITLQHVPSLCFFLILKTNL